MDRHSAQGLLDFVIVCSGGAVSSKGQQCDTPPTHSERPMMWWTHYLVQSEKAAPTEPSWTIRRVRSTRETPSGPDPPAEQSVIMKYTIIATLFVLALAQGSLAQDAQDLEKISQYLEEMKTKMTQEMTQIFQNHDLANQAQTFFEERRTQLEALAPQVQEQLQSVATTVEEQIKPLATNMQAQMQPMLDNFQKQVEAIFQKMTEQAKALAN